MSQQALNELKKFTGFFKVFSEAENAMKELTTLEQTHRDLLLNVEKLQKDNDDLEASVEELKILKDALDEEYKRKKKEKEQSLYESTEAMIKSAEDKVAAVLATEDLRRQELITENQKLLARNQQLQDSINYKTIKEEELTSKIEAATKTIENMLGKN